MIDKVDVKFRRIFCDFNPVNKYAVFAVIELPNQFHSADQERKRLIQLGHMQHDGLMMKFVITSKVYIVDIGHYEHPLKLFEGARVSPTMKGTKDFCDTMMAHLKLMGDNV